MNVWYFAKVIPFLTMFKALKDVSFMILWNENTVKEINEKVAIFS